MTLLPSPTAAPTSTPTPADTSQLALTPPMGWNDYNRFGCDINEKVVQETADAMVSSGLQAAGYKYILIDDCWMAHERDVDGNLQADPEKFPHGMQAMAGYVHAKGLKFGLYLDRGSETCGHYPGSYGHEIQDANQLAAWEVDYLKYDNCSPVGNLVTDYQNMSNALKATGRPIVFSMCTWGFPGYWAQGVGQLWRTTSDIKDQWTSLLSIIDANNINSASAGPGHWNDPDMLEVGNGGMSEMEYRAHFSMWAMMAAPLIAGNDLRNMDPTTLDILTAPEVIAVDQDPLGIQGKRVSRITALSGPQVWSKQLAGVNTQAVALFNRSDQSVSMTADWKQIGLPAGSAIVRDLWARADLGVFNNSYTANVPAHAVVLVKIVSAAEPATATPTSQGAVVTFRVAGREQYKVRLTDPADIEIARKLLAGEPAPRTPNGVVVRDGPDVNVGYTWHIDPQSFEFADVTTEVCDGLPSDVEKGIITSEYYCPWSAEVIAVDA